SLPLLCFFSFSLPAPSVLYPLSLHDALPICGSCARQPPPNHPDRAWLNPSVPPGSRGSGGRRCSSRRGCHRPCGSRPRLPSALPNRKSTRLNSSHVKISYAVFCLKKKKHIHT